MPRYLVPVLVLAVLLAVIGMAGCISPPTVAIDGVRIGSVTPDSTTLLVEVGITNPNPLEIPVQEVRFTVGVVEGTGVRPLGTGNAGPFVLPAGRASRQQVPVTLGNRPLLEAARVAVGSGQDRITVRVSGTVRGDLYGLTTVDVPFEQDRVVTLAEVLGSAGVPVDGAALERALGQAAPVVRDLVPGG